MTGSAVDLFAVLVADDDAVGVLRLRADGRSARRLLDRLLHLGGWSAPQSSLMLVPVGARAHCDYFGAELANTPAATL